MHWGFDSKTESDDSSQKDIQVKISSWCKKKEGYGFCCLMPFQQYFSYIVVWKKNKNNIKIKPNKREKAWTWQKQNKTNKTKQINKTNHYGHVTKEHEFVLISPPKKNKPSTRKLYQNKYLGDNCIVFENFTASIWYLMATNWVDWRHVSGASKQIFATIQSTIDAVKFQIQYSYLHSNVIMCRIDIHTSYM